MPAPTASPTIPVAAVFAKLLLDIFSLLIKKINVDVSRLAIPLFD
jgi:hypothetical protein